MRSVKTIYVNRIILLPESRKTSPGARQFPIDSVVRAAHCALLCSIAAALAWGQTAPVFTISTIAGNGTAGFSGDGGAATQAQLYLPSAAVFVGGSLYIADQVNDRLRIVSGGNMNTLAGTGTAGYSGDGKAATLAELFDPVGLVVDSSGNVYFSDTRNQVVRKITTAGVISTYAGNNAEGAGFSGDTGSSMNAQLNNPSGLALDKAGNLYIADAANNKIRIATPGNVINTFAGNFFGDFLGDGGPALQAELNNPEGVAVDAAGNVYIADTANNRIRLVTLDGNIHTVAGNGTAGFAGDKGQATNAELNHPEGVAADAAGNIYIADTFNQRIRMVLTNGAIVTIAGTGIEGYTGDGGPGTQAQLSFPASVSLDSAGNLYVSDSQNYVIRELSPSVVPAGPGIPSVAGAVSASGFGAFPSVALGSWIEIYGTNLAADTRLWAASDFSGVNAPTTLDRTTVTIGGQPAYVDFVSPGQVNAQVPTANLAPGPQALTVMNADGLSKTFQITVNTTQPGLFAPAALTVGGKQYVGALFANTATTTYVAPPGTAPGITSQRAHPGDTIVLYGVGFGTVSPPVPAGQITQLSNTLTSTVTISIGGVTAQVTYAGLAPGEVGLYQFNVVVPQGPSSDAAPVTFTLGGTAGTQTLYTSVQD